MDATQACSTTEIKYPELLVIVADNINDSHIQQLRNTVTQIVNQMLLKFVGIAVEQRLYKFPGHGAWDVPLILTLARQIELG